MIRGNSLYTVVDGPSWAQAEANAQKVGGHLVTINSKEEDVWLSKNVYGDQYIINGGTPSLQNPINSYYIGYNDIATERAYRWSSGEEVTYNGVAPSPTFDDNHPNAINTDVFVVNSNADGTTGHWINVDNTASWYRGGNSPGVSVDIKAIIETPFIRRGDSAYVVVQGPTWEEAEANAQKLGGHLATINDAAENDWLSQTFGTAGRSSLSFGAPIQIPGDAFALWIGATDKANEGSWTNSIGQPLAYANWFSSEPNNVGWYDPNGEDYAGIRQNGTWFDSGGNAPYSDMAFSGIAEIKITPDKDPKATPTLTTVAAFASDTASASGLEGLNLDVGGAANIQAPVTLKSTSHASTVEGNVKSDAHATEVLGISASNLHAASDLSVGSALQSIVSGSAESTSGIAIANALVDTQRGIDLTNPSVGVDALASGGSSTVVSTSTLTATSSAQTVGDGASDSGAQKLDGAWSNTIAKDHLGLGSTDTLTLDSESNATVSTSMLSKLSSTATANDGLAAASSQLLSSTGIENFNAEVGGLGLVSAINQGVFKADATSTTDDASAMGINKSSVGILDSTFTFGITDSTITAKDISSLQVSATSTGGDAWSKLQSSSTGIADLNGIENRITDAGSISAIASDQGFAHSATVSGSSTAFATQEAIGISGYEVYNHSDLTLSAQAFVTSESNSSAVG